MDEDLLPVARCRGGHVTDRHAADIDYVGRDQRQDARCEEGQKPRYKSCYPVHVHCNRYGRVHVTYLIGYLTGMSNEMCRHWHRYEREVMVHGSCIVSAAGVRYGLLYERW